MAPWTAFKQVWQPFSLRCGCLCTQSERRVSGTLLAWTCGLLVCVELDGLYYIFFFFFFTVQWAFFDTSQYHNNVSLFCFIFPLIQNYHGETMIVLTVALHPFLVTSKHWKTSLFPILQCRPFFFKITNVYCTSDLADAGAFVDCSVRFSWLQTFNCWSSGSNI